MLDAPKPISKRMIELLEEQRDSCNEKFLLHVSQGSRLDPTVWLRHVRDRIAVVVDAVEEHFPERSRMAFSELYDISLDLFSLGHLRDEGSSLQLLQIWERLLPKLGKFIARDPRRVVGSLCNAVLNTSQTSLQVADQWIECMTRVGPYAETVDQLLNLGKFAAWRCGQAEYRLAALKIAESLPASLLTMTLAPTISVPDTEIHSLIRLSENDPWILARAGSHQGIQAALVGGQFVGYGGMFYHPPLVRKLNGDLCVTDRRHVWRIDADSFGFRLHNLELAPEDLKTEIQNQDPMVDSNGKITWSNNVLLREDLANPTSYASNGSTLAVTIANSFHVFLFSRSTADKE